MELVIRNCKWNCMAISSNLYRIFNYFVIFFFFPSTFSLFVSILNFARICPTPLTTTPVPSPLPPPGFYGPENLRWYCLMHYKYWFLQVCAIRLFIDNFPRVYEKWSDIYITWRCVELLTFLLWTFIVYDIDLMNMLYDKR